MRLCGYVDIGGSFIQTKVLRIPHNVYESLVTQILCECPSVDNNI